VAPIRARLPLGNDHPEGGLETVRTIPIRTHILTPRDDLIQVVRGYALPYCGPDSVVAISESAVAIVQRRYLNPDDVRPGFLARLVARFIDRTGSLSSPYALQAVMNEEGGLRVAGAFLLGVLSRLCLGRRGDFYRLAGAQAALVDDVTGTLPPFDKYIVLGPTRPRQVVESLRRAIGVEVAIVDVNDLGGVCILAATDRVDSGALASALRPNPAGNSDEQTPIVVVRRATL
jgi:F420-0:gamma-glutamyl ligase